MDKGSADLGRAGRRDPAGRHRHADLHQRHHRPAEGRDDQPVQRRVHRRVAAPLLRPRHLRRQARRQLPADGAHRRADDEPLPIADPRLQRVLLSRCQPAVRVPQGGAPRDRVRRATRVGEDLQRRQRGAGREPREQGEVRRGRRRGDRHQGGRARRNRHQGAARHVGVPRRGRVRQRPRASSGSTPSSPRSPAPRRSPARSSSGTTRSACRSARSTG